MFFLFLLLGMPLSYREGKARCMGPDTPSSHCFAFPVFWWLSREGSILSNLLVTDFRCFFSCGRTRFQTGVWEGSGQGTGSCCPVPSPGSHLLAASMTCPCFFYPREFLSVQRQEKLDLQVFLCGFFFFLKLKSQECGIFVLQFPGLLLLPAVGLQSQLPQ